MLSSSYVCFGSLLLCPPGPPLPSVPLQLTRSEVVPCPVTAPPWTASSTSWAELPELYSKCPLLDPLSPRAFLSQALVAAVALRSPLLWFLADLDVHSSQNLALVRLACLVAQFVGLSVGWVACAALARVADTAFAFASAVAAGDVAAFEVAVVVVVVVDEFVAAAAEFGARAAAAWVAQRSLNFA